MELVKNTWPGRLLLLGSALAVLGASRCLACVGKNLIRTGVTCQDKRSILDEHNRLRQLVALGQVHGQPSAKMMMEMRSWWILLGIHNRDLDEDERRLAILKLSQAWDDELAAMAQQWASRCSETHDNARNVGRFSVGQNMARTWTTRTPAGPYDTEPDWRNQIITWFNEVQHYTFGYSSTTAHYTQVVWGDTIFVGCGYSFYYDPIRGYTKNYVCNYGPGGNVLGYKPYSFGWPECNEYGVDYSNKYSGLCSRAVYYPLGAYCAYG